MTKETERKGTPFTHFAFNPNLSACPARDFSGDIKTQA